jgi:hypothetical protein
MPPRTAVALLLVSLVLALPACEKKPRGGADRSADPPLVVPDKVSIQLGTARGEGRRVLRYAFKAGVKHVAVMEMKMSMAMEVGSRKLPETALPLMRMNLEIDAQSVSPEGELTYAYTIPSAEVDETAGVPEPLVTQMRQALKLVAGLRGSGVIAASGLNKKAKIELPPGLPPMLTQMMESVQQQMGQMAAPLPAEPVGPGSTWTVNQPLDLKAFRVGQRVTYTLVSLEGNQARLKLKLEQYAPPQDVAAPGMPAGQTMRLRRMKMTGTSEMTVDLTSPVAAAKMTGASDSVMGIEAGGQSQDLKMQVKLGMTLLPR